MDSSAPATQQERGDGDQAMQRPLEPRSAQVPHLPHLVWRHIVFFLSDDLSALLVLSSLDYQLQSICRPYTSTHFQTVRHAPRPFPTETYFHSLVRLVLERHVDPCSILEFYNVDQYERNPEFQYAAMGRTDRPGLHSSATDQEVRAFDRLIEEAVRESRFIPRDLEEEVCARFRCGDWDAALVILLPLCSRLKSLEIPKDSPLCAALFQRVAQEYLRRGIAPKAARRASAEAAMRDLQGRPWRGHSDPEGQLPFSELLFLFTHRGVAGREFPLVEMTPFMGLPSLHRIELTFVLNDSFPGWQAGDVRCSCPEIYFVLSAATESTVLKFAEGLNGSCEIKQWYADWTGPHDEDFEWDHVIVEKLADGSSEIEARIDYWGAGEDTDWAAWCFAGKMTDWRRLHEEVVVTEEELIAYERADATGYP